MRVSLQRASSGLQAPPGKPVILSDPSSLGSLVGALRFMVPDSRIAPTDRSFTEAVMIQECR